MAGLLNHVQEGRPFREELGIPEFTLFFLGSHFTYSFHFGHNPKFNAQRKRLSFIYGTWHLREALATSRKVAGSIPDVVIGIFL
jgi:hypothetical protein